MTARALGVRGYRIDDAAACSEIIDDAIGELPGLNDAALAFLRSRNAPGLLGAELAGYYTVVFERDGALLGLGALVGDEVRRMYVRPAAQGTGAGRAILAALETEARRRGLVELRASAALSAVGFYERSGFEAIGPCEHVHGDARFEYVRMRKRLGVARR